MRTGWLAILWLLSPGAALADEPARPVTLPALTHPHPEVSTDTTLASVLFRGGGADRATYSHVERVAVEVPIIAPHWYAGAGYDAAFGTAPLGGTLLISGNPEFWWRGVWSSPYGLAFGGGIAAVIPTLSFAPDGGPGASVAAGAVASRGWERALFDPQFATVRPFLDMRFISGILTLQYRQSLEAATNFSSLTTYRMAAVGTLDMALRVSRLVSVAGELIEYYRLESGISDADRSYLAVGAHVRLSTRYYQPSIGLVTNIGSPLDTIAQVGGAPVSTSPAAFVGLRIGITFPIARAGSD